MSKQPNVVVNYLYNLAYKLLVLAIPLITTPYISRVLRAEGVGAFSFAQSLATYFSIFGIMGLNMSGQLQIARARDDRGQVSKIFSEVFPAKACTSLLSLLLYAIFIQSSDRDHLLLGIMGIMMLANILDIAWLFQGMEEFRKVALKNGFIKLIGLVLLLSLVKDKDDVWLYALILQGSTLLGNVSLWWRLKRYLDPRRPSVSGIIRQIRESFVYFLPTVATVIYSYTDKVMLGYIIGSDYDNGIYEQAHKIEQVTVTIIASINTVLLPRMTYLYSDQDEERRRRYIDTAMQAVGLMAIPIMCGLIGISDVLIPVFLGKGFDGAEPLLRVFSVLLLFSGTNTMLGNSVLVASGKQKWYNTGVLTGALLNVLLNAILIPVMKTSGAAAASLISEIVIFVIFVVFTGRIGIPTLHYVKCWKHYFFAGIPMGVAVWYMGRRMPLSLATMLLQVGVGVVIYIGLLVLMRDDMLRRVKKEL